MGHLNQAYKISTMQYQKIYSSSVRIYEWLKIIPYLNVTTTD